MQIFTRTIKTMMLLTLVSFSVPALAQEDPANRDAGADAVTVQTNKNYTGLKVTGTITDAVSGEPLPGVKVSIPEYSAAITDEKGTFSIDVPSYKVTLLLSSQDYQNKEIALKGKQEVSLALHQKGFATAYESVMMPGGAISKSQVPYAVSAVNPNNSWNRAMELPDNYLQGQLMGMDVVRRSGTPGQGAEMFLRGFSSLNGSNRPLVVVDGMIYDYESYGSSLISEHLVNPLSNIDIKDIDNITVIKDGASLYGTKGANGVILITTAHAKELATKIDFAAYGGVNVAPKNLPVMNSSSYRLYLSDVLRTGGMTDAQLQAQPYMNDDPNNPEYARYHSDTNWQDKVLGNSINQNYYLKVTGGDNIARYALSVGYLENNSVIKESNLKRYSTRFNADMNLSPRLTANTSLSFTSNEQNLSNQGLHFSTNPIMAALVKAPFLRIRQVTDQGIESPNLADTDIFGRSNPVSLIENVQAQDQNYRFFGSAKLNYAFSKYSTLSSLIGLSFDKVRENIFIPRLGVTPEELDNAIAYSRLGNRVQRYNSIYNDTYYSYNRSWAGEHSLVATAGFRFNNLTSEEDRAYGFNSPTDDFTTVGMGANTLRRMAGDIGEARWLNMYSSVNYSFLSKYLLSLNLSVDGSSRFGREIPDALTINGNKYAVMPSVAAGWLISSENFMGGVDFVDLLKLRASYGLTGNDDIGNYTGRQYYVSQNLLGAQGTVRGNLANPQIRWETNTKTNLGLDVALFKERLSMTVDVYDNKTTDMLVYEPVFAATGFDYILTNNGSMKNQGIDLGLYTRVLNRAVKLDLGLNLSTYRNEITSIPGNSKLTEFAGATILTEVGKPANQFYGYKTNGIFTTEQQAAEANLKTQLPDGTLVPFKGGDVRFADLDGNGIIDERDRTVIGNSNPDFFGSLSSSVSWKRFSVSAIFSFRSGNDIYNGVRANLESMSSTNNQLASTENRWQFDGQNTTMPRAAYGDPMGNARFSDRWIEDGSFIRLRTLAITYDLPLKQGFVKSSSVYATANNLFTSTNYIGYDPEFSASRSPIGQGIDVGLEPLYKSIQFGVRIGL
ncbi:SusC/RagA family TonB-linked outer membrane protein [Pontibacter beigongshangensis]|uniref:SusC/RagA family TonB-linked outer membrane protein n=1 Tax=Pontibacter beigongshangensis TaxID=2574733 RepID=UPI00164FE49A|nr:SusC/RagA family TonB-linked outer membrane protein [Pontibacter beigongshangensis]